MKKKRNTARDIGFYALILVILLATIFMLTNKSGRVTEIDYDELVENLEGEKIETLIIEGDLVTVKLRGEEEGDKPTVVTHKLMDRNYFLVTHGDLIEQQKAEGIIEEYNYIPAKENSWIWFILQYGLLFGLVILFFVYMSKMAKRNGDGMGAMKFGKARTRLGSAETKKVTFADVAGAEEEKEELEEIVSFLKNPEAYKDIGARIPKGVLLVGPPGTGKTLLAKAVAGEAGVQFLSISGSDFVELYVGVGASRVRDLFEQAKKIAPAIIFIDEIDAVGRQRGSGLGGGHDEREQTLNQLLVEMDGFGNNEGVIVMAATNRADILDNALLRPGRFDRTVYVGLPDVRGREAILKVHAKGKPLAEDVDLNSIARGTPGFSGADLENLLNEAAIMSVRNKRRFITQADINESILKVMAGPEKKSKVMSEAAKRLAAYHEAGHAIAGHYMECTDPVEYITIIPRGPTGGMTVYRPSEDKESFTSRGEMFADIVVALGGRMSEKLMLDDISTGASGDIHSATETARSMVTQYGFSERLGPISFDNSDHSIFIGRDFGKTKSYSEETAAIIDEEVKKIFDAAGKRCEDILTEHRDVLIKTAEFLIVNETMTGEEFSFLCENGYVPERAKKEETPVENENVKEEETVLADNENAEAAPLTDENEDKTSDK